MDVVQLKIDISYGQFAVFCSSLSNPFNDWTQRHLDQGFAWRPGSVSFRTLSESGVHSLSVEIVDSFGAIEADVARAIEVPFEVPLDSDIEIASISDGAALSMPAGRYCLRCELFADRSFDHEFVKLIFGRLEKERFLVILESGEVIRESDLLKSAEAALI